jgi:Arc/MetJ-type ribon-helix-helix transcriptional regulator
MKGYRSTALPEDLVQRIDKVVESNIGYISIIDFVKEAIRMRLDEVEQKVIELERIKKQLKD